ncbi:MAG TPA: hypothetical protein VEZ14_09625 [Dehalococcoidia bacterium]|nr:hypothetical protein [Dehalococcoidia bacterium]
MREEDAVAASQARGARDAARYRAGVARFLGVPAAQVAGEPVRNYRRARVRSYARSSPAEPHAPPLSLDAE